MTDAGAAAPPLLVQVWSDYICPFCHVARERMAYMEREHGAQVEWFPFDLHPEYPADGLRRATLETLYGGPGFDQPVRDMAEAAGLVLAKDERRQDLWSTQAGGSFRAAGVGGPLTGSGLDVCIIDDLYKSRVQAESHAYRQMVRDWFRDVALTRIEPGGSVVVFHTRWVPDDLIGELLAGEDAAARVADVLAEAKAI